MLLLILTGMLLGSLKLQGQQLISFPTEFLSGVAILALVMIVFDGTSNFKMREIDEMSVRILKLVFTFMFLNIIFLTLATLLLFRFESLSFFHELALALIFVFINCGTDPGTVMVMLKDSKSQIPKILQIESVMNTPFMVLLPFIVIDVLDNLQSGVILSQIAQQAVPFLNQFAAGIGSGVMVGIVFFKFMRKQYSERLSPLAIITAALLTYTLAENLGGNGVLAVTTLGLFFGNMIITKKEQLIEFSSVFALALEILVFVFVGLIVEIPISLDFFIRSVGLFLIYLVIRYLSIYFVFRKDKTTKEILFMTLNVSKGIAVASIVFALTTLFTNPANILYNLAGVNSLLNLTIAFMIYSIVLSTVAVRYENYFL